MVKSNLAAWTPDVINPPFLSINYLHGINPSVEIIIRGGEKKDGSLGDSVSVKLTKDEFIKLMRDIEENASQISV